MRHTLLPLSAAAILLAGCSVGNDYAGPPATASDAVARGTFVRAGDPAFAPAPPLAQWWTALGDPLLDTLVDDALAGSPTIAAATSRIAEAQATVRERRAGRSPTISANALYAHADLPGVDLGGAEEGGEGQGGGGDQSLNFFNLGLNASWEPDFAGGRRRAEEQAGAAVGQRYADLADAQVTLSAQVADTYVAYREVQARLALTEQLAILQERRLDLMRQRQAAGTASQLQVEQQQSQLASTRADAVPLASQRDEYLGLLAVLTGRTPGALDATLATPMPVPLPPASVPIGDPAQLIARRPDVRAAERQLAGASAAVGVARARELPAVRLMGIVGLGGTAVRDIFDPADLAVLALPQLTWNLLDGGAARANTQGARARLDTAEAQYRQAVLEALQDAEVSLSRFGNTRRQLGRLGQVQDSAARAAALNAQRVAAGTSSTLDQIDLEGRQVNAAIGVGQARAQLTRAYVAVNKALGLGWDAPQ